MNLPFALGSLVFALAMLALFFAARRAVTLAALEVDDGQLRVSHGQLAPGVLGDLRDIVRRPNVGRGTIRIVRDGGRAAVKLSGDFSEAQAQRIRNVVGIVPLSRLGAGGRGR